MSAVTSTELSYLSSILCDFQTQFSNLYLKSEVDASLISEQHVIASGASTISVDSFTFNRALISNGSGQVAVSNATHVELSYLSGLS